MRGANRAADFESVTEVTIASIRELRNGSEPGCSSSGLSDGNDSSSGIPSSLPGSRLRVRAWIMSRSSMMESASDCTDRSGASALWRHCGSGRQIRTLPWGTSAVSS